MAAFKLSRHLAASAVFLAAVFNCRWLAAEETAGDVNMPKLEYLPFDGGGRYAADKADGIREYQGLLALRKRYGQKPYEKLWKNDHWQCERLCFCDIATGAPIVRLTDDYGSDYVDYHRGAWSADGKWVVWRRCPGMWESSTATNGPTAVRSDGTGLKPVFRDAGSNLVRKYQCSKLDPRLCYSMVDDKKLVEFDLETGKKVRELAEPGGSWHLKMSQDGKFLCSCCKQGDVRTLWLVSVDGKEKYNVTVTDSIHDSYLPHPILRKMIYWYEGKFHTEGFCQKDFDNTNETKIPYQFDWNHGDFGQDRGIHETGRIFRYNNDKWGPPEELYNPKPGTEYYDDPADFNGYTSWMPKDLPWAVQTKIFHRPYLSEFFLCGIEPVSGDVVNRFRLGYTNLIRGGALDCADGSPDGTKFVYNSNMFDSSQVYYMVIKRPEAPRELVCAGEQLTWKPAAHSKETKGYRVYRAPASGGPYACIEYGPLAATSFAIPRTAAGKAFYAVTAVEHSGLESGFSNEAASAAGARQNIFVEATGAKLTPQMWLCFDAQASSLYYIWQRKKDTEGKAAISASLPSAGNYTLWLRVKGRETAKFAVLAGATKNEIEAAAKNWTWVKCPSPAALAAGANEITVTTSLYGSALDALWLAADPAFTPSGKNAEPAAPPAKVEGLAAQAKSPFAVQLSWQPSEDKSVRHYNLYCSTDKDAPVSRATLIASPEEPEHLDWKAAPNAKLFYRLTAVNNRWHESPPSAPVEVDTGKLETVKLEKPVPAEGGTVDFDVPSDGAYVVWLQFGSKGGKGEYIDLDFDGKAKRTWTCRWDGIHGAEVTNISYGQFATWDLKAGAHKLKIDNKAGHELRKVFLTNDFSFMPEGYCSTKCVW